MKEYKLCKLLKENGFPQPETIQPYQQWYSEAHESKLIIVNEKSFYDTLDEELIDIRDNFQINAVYRPTVEELVQHIDPDVSITWNYWSNQWKVSASTGKKYHWCDSNLFTALVIAWHAMMSSDLKAMDKILSIVGEE